MRHRGARQQGFTLLEVMIVVAIMGILAATAVYNNNKQKARVLRSEVLLALDKIKEAQEVHYIEYGEYAGNFDDLVFSTSTGSGIGGCDNTNNRRCYQGGVYQYLIDQPWGPKSYFITATGNIDGDAYLDKWVIETGRFN